MKGGENRQPLGYTIIEVMVFLAVSSLMFVLAASFINGKQANVEFKQAMQSVNTQIQGIVNKVANGEYPSLGDFTCKVIGMSTAGHTPSFLKLPPLSPSNQGTNGGTSIPNDTTGCTFLGMVMQFAVGGNPSAYNVYTVAARQANRLGKAIGGDSIPGDTGWYEAQAVAIDNKLNTPYDTLGTGVNLTAYKQIEGQMQATAMKLCTSPVSCSDIGGFGFFASFGSAQAFTPPNLTSGSQTVLAATLPPITPNDENHMITQINTKLGQSAPNAQAATVVPGSYMLLCFKYNAKRGAITIGDNAGQQFTTTVNTGGAPAACP